MLRHSNNIFSKRILAFLCSVFIMTTVFAGTPLWTFEPLTPTKIAVPSNGTAMVQYRVTNQSSKPHTLAMQPIPGITQITTGLNVSGNPFVLGGKSSCVLSLQINGNQLNAPVMDGTVVPQTNFTIQGTNTNALTAAIAIQSSSKLTAINPTSGTASDGTGFTLTGTGLTGATDVTFDGIAATSVNVVNSTTVTGVTPAHAAGVVNVMIDTSVGGATLANGYTYAATVVGQSAFGGTIACLNGGLNDLIAATADNSTAIQWGGVSTSVLVQERKVMWMELIIPLPLLPHWVIMAAQLMRQNCVMTLRWSPKATLPVR